MKGDNARGLSFKMGIVLAFTITLAGCSETGDEASLGTSDGGFEVGQPCSTPGQFSESSEGSSLICSSRSESGEQLPSPEWRASSGDVAGGLNDDQLRAVDIVRQAYAAHPAGGSWPESNETTLLFVNEMASAAALASQQQIEPLVGFDNLVSGYAGANQVSQDTAIAAVSGLLLGVIELFGDGSESGSYAFAMLEAAFDATGGTGG